MELKEILEAQRACFKSGVTLDIANRKVCLKRLLAKISEKKEALQQALYADLGKSATESSMSEISLVMGEIRYMLSHLARWAKPKKVGTAVSQFPGSCRVLHQPYGTVLIMSPWNYPVLLTLSPLVNALAAGNTAVVKPSAYAPSVSKVIAELIAETFDKSTVAVIEGGREENARLLDEKFDYIFFTGGLNVGKTVLQKAAEHLTPVTLELGGKSPCLVDATADIEYAARRIVFGKFLNCGQTCVAPDYVVVEQAVKEKLVNALQKEIQRQFGASPLENENYGKIVNKKHFDRLKTLFKDEKDIIGGQTREDEQRITPTLLPCATQDSAAMQEEIFGPILPILTVGRIAEAESVIARHPTPLALYLFSESKRTIAYFTERVSYGGGCVNDCVIHLATVKMGFGGVGTSGMGAYHGKAGFDTFTHNKSVLFQSTSIDIPIRYQPYTKFKKWLIGKLM